MSNNDDAGFVCQGRLDVPEAKKILPHLERAEIRFRIDTDLSAHGTAEAGKYFGGRIRLYVHIDDVPAWERMRIEYFPEGLRHERAYGE